MFIYPTPVPQETPPTKPPPMQQDRVVGALVLILGFVLLLAFVMSVDAAVIAPYNTRVQATQTAQGRQNTPRNRALPPGHPVIGTPAPPTPVVPGRIPPKPL
jgi:hypothetical protein